MPLHFLRGRNREQDSPFPPETPNPGLSAHEFYNKLVTDPLFAQVALDEIPNLVEKKTEVRRKKKFETFANQEAAISWARKFGLDPDALEQSLGASEVFPNMDERLQELSSHFIRRGDWYEDRTTYQLIHDPINLRYLLLSMQFLLDEQRFNNQLPELNKEAQDLLAHYFPTLVPQEPAELFVSYRGELSHSENAGSYLGKYKGKHYINLQFQSDKGHVTPPLFNPYRSAEFNSLGREVKTVIALAHEKIHQKHAEVTGDENFFSTKPLDTLLEETNLINASVKKVAKALTHARNQANADSEIGNKTVLARVIQEGLASAVEIALCLKQAQVTTGEEQTIWQSYATDRIQNYKQHYDQARKLSGHVPSEEYSFGLLGIMYKLMDSPTELTPEIIDLLLRLDLAKLYKIDKGSDEWETIFASPEAQLRKYQTE